MNQTLFIEFVRKWFGALASRFTETINGKKTGPTYLFKDMLKKVYSADLKWNSLSVESSIVAADVVAMDSPLPLKRRDVIKKADGDLPKIGMKLAKGEKLISDINIMRARGATEAQIVAKIFEDSPKCQSGVYERLEYCFLQALSTGITLVPDLDNVGTGIRVNYGYLDKNKFGAVIKWGENGYAPLSDVTRVVAAASDEGDSISIVMLTKKSFNLMRNSDEGKQLSANFRGLVITDGKYPVPTPSQFNEAIKDEYGFEFRIVDRTIRIEKNGKPKPVKPFDENILVFLTTDQVGTLTYGTLAEETNPVAGVVYQKVDDYILLSKYSKNDPLREFTSSQALVLPVIENVEQIYLLNTQEAQVISDKEVEGDATVTVYDAKYTKTEVIAALKTAGVKAAANISDAKLIAKINELSDEDEAKVKAEIEKLTPVTEA